MELKCFMAVYMHMRNISQTNFQKKALKCKPSGQFDKNIATFGLKTSLHVLGEHTGTKTELYHNNVKSHKVICRALLQHRLH